MVHSLAACLFSGSLFILRQPVFSPAAEVRQRIRSYEPSPPKKTHWIAGSSVRVE